MPLAEKCFGNPQNTSGIFCYCDTESPCSDYRATLTVEVNLVMNRYTSRVLFFLSAITLLFFYGCGGGGEVDSGVADAEFSYTFDSDKEGWTVDFADLPVDYDQPLYELDYDHSLLPDDLEGGGIYVQGHNRSEDLFMFLKRQVEGLTPKAIYAVSVSIDLATNVPAESLGIGGSPGSSVYVKAGASTIEPDTFESRGYRRMNIDKGNQATSGKSMVVLGDLAHTEVDEIDPKYLIKTVDNSDSPLSVEADDEGRIWLIVGTDSGFEGLTALYYARISYELAVE